MPVLQNRLKPGPQPFQLNKALLPVVRETGYILKFMIKLSQHLRLGLIALCFGNLLVAQNREVLAEFKIGIVGHDLEDPTYQAAHSGAEDAAKALSEQYSIDVEVVVLTPKQAEGEDQLTALGQLLTEEADGFLISPKHVDDVSSSISFALEQGQEVVLFEQSIEELPVLASMVADEAEVGKLAAQAILPKLPTRGRVAILISEAPSPAELERLAGVREVLGYKRIETIVRSQPNYAAANEAIRQAEEADRSRLIKGWILLNDWALRGTSALPWKPGELPCVAVQTSPSVILYLKQEYIDAFVVHPHYEWGKTGVELMVNKLYKESDPEASTITAPAKIIDWRNVDDYQKDWKHWLK